jgi:tRNA pseudouridine13 synthase
MEGPDLRILEVTRHTNKLRRGHLRGNRFAIRIRDTSVSSDWEALIAHVTTVGFPNYFGSQRFGPSGSNPDAGRRILARSRKVRRLRESDRFLVNAYQAELFNGLLSRRLAELGSLACLLEGDLAILHRNGATFPAVGDDWAAACPRAHAGEISPSAPLFGCRITLATGVPGAWEHEALAREHLSLEDFRLGSKDASIAGERRAVRAFPQDLQWRHAENKADSLWLNFILPPGVYATSLLRELMKAPEAGPGAGVEAPPEEG